MNHSGLGFISNGNLELPPDLLEQFSMPYDNSLYGVFYPPPDTKEYSNVTIPFDFMLTPIHYRFWPISARLVLRVHNHPGALSSITKFLALNHVSIIHSETSRSGYRYSTLSFHIVFEDLLEDVFGKERTFDIKSTTFEATKQKIEEIKSSIDTDCKDQLFRDENDIDLIEPVNIHPNTALAYFYNRYLVENGSKDEHAYFRPFKLEISTGEGWMYDVSKQIQLATAYQRGVKNINVCNLERSVVFANLDTRYHNIRLVIIPQEDFLRFQFAIFKYERTDFPDRCKGLISSICNCFPEHTNVWWSFNNVTSSEINYEIGHITFLLEDTRLNLSDSTYKSEGIKLIKHVEIESSNFLNSRIRFVYMDIAALNIEFAKAFKMIKDNIKCNYEYKYDVFVSCLDTDLGYARNVKTILTKRGITVYLAEGKIDPGEPFAEEIKEALNDSRELCLIWSKETSRSEWVATEWGIAWYCNKLIVPICLGTEYITLPLRIRQLASLTSPGYEDALFESNSLDLEKYAETVSVRNYQHFILRSRR